MSTTKITNKRNYFFIVRVIVVVIFRCNLAWPAPTNIAPRSSLKLQILRLMSSMFLILCFSCFCSSIKTRFLCFYSKIYVLNNNVSNITLLRVAVRFKCDCDSDAYVLYNGTHYRVKYVAYCRISIGRRERPVGLRNV